MKCNRLSISLFFKCRLSCWQYWLFRLLLYCLCAIKHTIYTHETCAQSPTNATHITHVCVWGTCVWVYCSNHVSSGPVAPGEIYEVLRMLASSLVLGDWSHPLACLCPCLTPHIASTHKSTNRHTAVCVRTVPPCTNTYCTCTSTPEPKSVSLMSAQPPSPLWETHFLGESSPPLNTPPYPGYTTSNDCLTKPLLAFVNPEIMLSRGGPLREESFSWSSVEGCCRSRGEGSTFHSFHKHHESPRLLTLLGVTEDALCPAVATYSISKRDTQGEYETCI